MLKDDKLISINIVVWNAAEFNGGKYICPCLDSVRNQTHENIEVNILDNNSTDGTRDIIRREYPEFNLIKRKDNPGLWATHDEAMEYSSGEYILALSLDTILDPNFIEESVKIFEEDKKIGAIQAKIYSYGSYNISGNISDRTPTKIIDTLGFKLLRSRRLINDGHGETDKGQYEQERQIFGVEGAAPIFRKSALKDIQIDGEFTDHDYFWYGDDFDIAWRMTLFGWKQIYSPKVIGYHDRSTTKDYSRGGIDYLRRIKRRKQIPIKKRRLDWANTRFTIIKNDYIVNLLKDLPWILAREAAVFFYTLFIEPGVFQEYPRFFRLMPEMFKRRKKIMQKAKLSPKEIRQLQMQ